MNQPQATQQQTAAAGNAKVIALRPPTRWHDPLKLIQDEAPSGAGRIVLWTVSILILVLIIWAAFGQLDIIAGAEGKLAPQTLLKVVQPAELGVVQALLVAEGDSVKAGQVLARLDTTIAHAEQTGVVLDLASQSMQIRRIEAELADRAMTPVRGDDPILYAQVQSQYRAHRTAFIEGLEQEKSLLSKAVHEKKSATEILAKLEQTLPTYKKAAEAYVKLEKEGFFGGLASADKQREALEKAKDLDAQQATVAALDATIAAQQKRVSQIQSNNQSDLQKELADLRAKVAQLRPTLNKTSYREGLMELRAPQDGVIKDLATTTVGAVVQPGTVVLTLIPKGEPLFADVSIKNEDVGFVRVGQSAKLKLATYPFQQYGMLTGTVIHISADANDATGANAASNRSANGGVVGDNATAPSGATYKARVRLDSQTLRDPQGNKLPLTAGMQVVAEINQGKRTVLAYLLSPVQKAVSESARER